MSTIVQQNAPFSTLRVLNLLNQEIENESFGFAKEESYFCSRKI
jgi:hypothetical protein